MLHILSLIGVLLLMVVSFLAGFLCWIVVMEYHYGKEESRKLFNQWVDTFVLSKREDDPDDSEAEFTE